MYTTYSPNRTFLAVTRVFALLSLCFTSQQALAAELTIQVRNVKSEQGSISIAVCNQPESFPGIIYQGQIVPAHAQTVSIVFKDLPPGAYAVSAFHDLNGNGRLDTNVLGIPKEPYGFSRNARSPLGPPKFADARIEVGNTPVVIEMDLK